MSQQKVQTGFSPRHHTTAAPSFVLMRRASCPPHFGHVNKRARPSPAHRIHGSSWQDPYIRYAFWILSFVSSFMFFMSLRLSPARGRGLVFFSFLRFLVLSRNKYGSPNIPTVPSAKFLPHLSYTDSC